MASAVLYEAALENPGTGPYVLAWTYRKELLAFIIFVTIVLIVMGFNLASASQEKMSTTSPGFWYLFAGGLGAVASVGLSIAIRRAESKVKFP